MKKSILAILAAPAAIPVNPNSAAIKAITKKITDQRNIMIVFYLFIYYVWYKICASIYISKTRQYVEHQGFLWKYFP